MCCTQNICCFMQVRSIPWRIVTQNTSPRYLFLFIGNYDLLFPEFLLWLNNLFLLPTVYSCNLSSLQDYREVIVVCVMIFLCWVQFWSFSWALLLSLDGDTWWLFNYLHMLQSLICSTLKFEGKVRMLAWNIVLH